MRKALLLASILVLNASVLLAQGQKTKKPIKGTYQIEVHNERAYPYIPDNFEELVIKNRKKTEISYFMLAPNVRVKVWPESTINVPGYVGPAKEIVHLNGVL